MADDVVQLKFEGDPAGLVASTQQALNASVAAMEKMTQAAQAMTDQSKKTSQEITSSNKQIQDAFGKMQEVAEKSFSGITGGLGVLRSHFVAIGALLAGGAMFSASIEAAKQWDGEVSKLARTMGVTTERASVLNTALRLIGTDTDTYTGALAMLTRQLRANEETLNRLGMATRDNNGHLVSGEQAMSNALAMIKQYKQGLDQTMVSQLAFGRGSEGVAALLRLNNDIMERAKTLADELGLKIGKDNVAAMRAYQVELNAFKLLWTSVEIKLGNEVMKVLTQVANYLNTDGRAAVGNFADMVKYLIGMLDLAISTARSFGQVWQFMGKLPGAVKEDLAAQVPVLTQDPLTGEDIPGMEASKEAGKRATGQLWDELMTGLDKIDKGFQERWEALWKNLPAPKISTETSGGGKSAPDDIFKEGKGKGGGGKSELFTAWEEELARIKDSQENLNTWSQAKEYEFWSQKLAATKRGSNEWWQIWHKMAEMFRSLTQEQQTELQKQAQQEKQISDERGRFELQHEQSMYEMQMQALQTRRELGQITEKDMLRIEKEMLDQRYQAQLADLRRRLELAKNDPDKDPVALEKIYLKMRQVTDKYWKDQQKLEDKTALDTKKRWDTVFSAMESGFGSAVKGMAKGTMDFGQAAMTVAEAVADAFIDMGAKILVEWVANKIKEIIFGKTAAQAGIMSMAAQGAVAAGASVAAIPVIGWTMVEGVMASTYAALMAFGTGANAVGYEVGAWDIPSQQLAKLHPGELVMPAEQAEDFRSGSSKLGNKGSGPEIHLHLYNIDAKSSLQWIKENRKSLQKEMQSTFRNFSHLGGK